MKKALLTFFLLTHFLLSQAQQFPLYFQPEQDCISAIPICGSTYFQNDYYLGFGENFEVLPLQNCVEPGEINSVWYVFSVASPGTLGFTINSNVDFDFAIWDISLGGCSEIGQAAPIRCNYSNSNSPTGMSAAAAVPGNINYGSSQPAIMPGLNVLAGQTYALWVNNLWLNPFTFSGYSINFSGSATLVSSASPPPTITVEACNIGQPIIVYTSAPIDCNTIDNGAFTMSGAVITDITGIDCGDFSTRLEIEYTLLGAPAASYTLTPTGLTDLCGNVVTAPANFTFPTPIQLTASTNAICGGIGATVTITSNIAGEWNTGAVGTSITVSPNATSVYTVEVINGSCSRTESITITVYPPAYAQITPQNTAVCTGGSVALSVLAPAGSFINWTGGPFNGGPNDQTIQATPSANTLYTVDITTPDGCTASNSTMVYSGAPAPDPTCVNLYVSPSGSPTGDGTRIDPVDLPTAISLAQCNNAVIKLSVGIYNFDQPIQLFDYITIEGGFLPGSDWEKISTDGTPATTTIINRTANGVYPYDGIAGAPALIAVQGNSISDFRLQDLTFTTANAPASPVEGVSTYGIYLNSCFNYNVVRCRALPGSASAGGNGVAGTAGAAGAPGGTGANGCSAAPLGSPSVNCSGQVSSAAGTGAGSVNAAGAGGTGANAGGQGGKGGWRSFNMGNGLNNGQNGLPGAGPGGGGGTGGIGNGPGGINIYNCVCDATAVTNGINGLSGTAGTAGTAGTLSPIAPIYSVLFIPGGQGSNGTNGTNGTGGGGGGGGGGQDSVEGFCLPNPPFGNVCISADLGSDAGSGGGGGGGGGFFGTAGTGAYSGGGSFGIFLWANGANGNFIDSNTAAGTVGAAGIGGAGGAGGAGGVGGQGGNAFPCSLNCITCLLPNPLPFGPSCLISISPGFPAFSLSPLAVGNGNWERDFGDGGDGGNGGAGGNGGNGGNGHPGQVQALYINGTPLTSSITNFNLTAQPVIQYTGQSCVDTDISFSGPSSQTWNLGANASPAVLSGATVTTQYNDIGRNTITYGSQVYTGFVNIVLDYVPEADIYTTAALLPPTIDEYQICAGDAVDFQALQLGIDYEWEFITLSGGPAPSPSVYPSNPPAPYENLDNIVFANPGVYTIRHRVKSDCCGWSEWKLITLHVEPIPNFSLLPNPAYLCGAELLQLNVNIINPTTVNPASILWTPATGLSDPTSLNPTVSGLIATTTYTVLAYNPAGNCYNQQTITVNVQNALQLAATQTPADCGPNGGIVINNVLNGIGPYTYAWQAPLTATGNSVSNLGVGTYTVLVTDNTTGCTVSQEFAINPSIETLQVSVKDIVPNCTGGGGNNASAEINWLSGIGPFTFVWAGPTSGTVTIPAGEQGYILTALPTGSYSVTVTDGGNTNCTDMVTFVVPDAIPMFLNLVASTGETSCGAADGTASVAASGGTPPSDPFISQYTYSWSHDPTLALPDAANLASGIYTVSVSDDAGCIIALDITIDPPTLNFSVNPPPSLCLGGSLDLTTLNGTGAGTFIWFDAIPSSGNAVTVVSPTATTTYWALYSENGCSDSTSVTVNISASPDFSVNNPPALCPGESLTLSSLNGTGAGTFEWFDAQPASGNAITVVTPVAPTTTYWVLYSEGTCSDSTSITVTLNPVPIFTVTPDATICAGDNFDLASLNGPETGTFEWFDAQPSSGSPQTSVSPTTTTTYWVLYTENGCSDSISADVIVAPIPDLAPITAPPVYCLDAAGTFDLTLFNPIENGGLTGTYDWYTDAGLSSPVPDATMVSVGGTYYVVFTSADNCTDVESVLITTSTLPNPPLNPVGAVACFGEPLPTISVADPGAGFTVNWYDAPSGGNNVGTGNSITAPATGTFYASITDDATACESATIEIMVTAGTALSLAELGNTCSDDLTVFETIVYPSGGSGIGYIIDANFYSLNANFDGTYTIGNIPNGTSATVTLTDSDGCSTSVNLSPVLCSCPSIAAPTNPVNAVACAGEPLPAVSVDDPGPGFTIYWYDAATGGNLLGAGNPFVPFTSGTVYAAIVNTANDCTGETTPVTITDNPTLQFIETGSVCAPDLVTFALSLSVTGGSGGGYTVDAAPYIVTDNGGGNFTISGIDTGTSASVTITDANGCATSGSLSSVNCNCPAVAAPANPTGATICNGGAPVAISVADPGAGFTVNWYTTAAGGTAVGTGVSFTPPAAGTYYAEVVEIASGCVSLRVPVVLTQTTALTSTLVDTVCSADLTTYNVEITVSGGTAPYTVNGGIYTVTNNGGGSFTLINVPVSTMSALNISDALGCSLPTIDFMPPSCQCPAVAPPLNPLNAGICSGDPLAQLSVDDPGAGYTIIWFDVATGGTLLATGNTFTPPAAGTYYAAVQQLVNGCLSSTIPVTLTQNAALALAAVNTTCAADLNSYAAQISVSGGTPPYTLDAGVLTATDNGDGTYTIANIPDNTPLTVLVSDAQACPAQITIAAVDCVCPPVAAPTNPVNNVYCFGETPTTISVADPGAGLNINWYNTLTGGVAIASGLSFTPAQAGTYYAGVQDVVNGCTGTRIPVVLTQNAQIVVQQGISTCSADLLTYEVAITVSGGNGTFTLTAGAATVTDNGGGSFTISDIPGSTAATVNITDGNGCTLSSDLNPVNCNCPLVPPPANPTGAFICFGQATTALTVNDPGAGFTVNWYNTPTGGIIAGTGNSFTPPAPGTYYAEIVDDAGCNSLRVPVVLTQGANIGLTQIDGFCSADLSTYSVNLLTSNTSGAVTTTATDDEGLNYNILDTGGGTLLVEDLPANYAGNITITLTDATGCTATLVIAPVICTCPVVAPPANPADAFICAGEAPVSLCVDDPGTNYSVQWYDTPAGGLLLGTGACYTPATAGTAYAVIVEDVNGCSSTSVAVTLTQGTAISITEASGICATDLLTYDVPLTLSGGTAPYTLSSGALTITDNGGGSYTVIGIASGTAATVDVADANGCTQSLTLTVANCNCASVPAPTNPVDGFSCFGQAAAALSVSSPGAGYTINWYDAPAGGTLLGTGNTYTPTTPGTYYAEATENLSGCVSTRIAVVLTQGTEIVITDSGSACSADLSTYDVTVAITGGTEPYTFDAGGYTVTPILDAWVVEAITSGTSVVLNLTDADGCTASLDLGTTTCNCAAVPAPTNPVNGVYCQGSTPVAISVGAPAAGFTVQWYNVAVGGAVLATGNTFTPSSAGTYYAEILETATGCVSSRVPVTLTETPLPPAPTANSPAPYCEGATITSLTATGSGGTLTWYSDASLTTVAGTGNSFTPATPAAGSAISYWVAETGNGCQGSATELTVSVIVCNCTPPASPVLTTNNLSICEGETGAEFTATADVGLEIRWYFAGALVGIGGTFIPTQAGTYTVTAYNTIEACESTPASATFELLPQPVADFTLSEAVCVGDAQTIAFTGSASPNAVYSWDFGAGANPATATGAGSHLVTWSTSGVKTVMLMVDENGCADNISLSIAVSDMTASIDPTTVFVDPGQSVTLTVTAASGLGTMLSYDWMPDVGCTDCASVSVMPDATTTTYTVMVTDEYGCAATVQATLNLVYKNQVLIPNAFSPNADGVNDVFRLTGYNVSEVELHIFNRWGEEVFYQTATNLTDGWNGVYKGKDQEIGVYVYYANVTFTDGTTETFKGNVTLVR